MHPDMIADLITAGAILLSIIAWETGTRIKRWLKRRRRPKVLHLLGTYDASETNDYSIKGE